MTLKSIKEKLISDYELLIKENEISKKDKLLFLVPIVIAVLVLILTLVTTILTFISVLFSFLSFIGIHQTSDLLNNTVNILQDIDNILNVYKNFNIDLKILIWSLVNIGFTYYVYKILATHKIHKEDLNKSDSLIPQSTEWNSQKMPSLENSENQNRIETLVSQINNLQTRLDILLKTQTTLQLELNNGDVKEALNDLRAKRSHEISKFLNNVTDEIRDILKKYEVKGKYRAHYVYNPYVKIILECYDKTGIVKIPATAIQEIQNLQHKFDIKIDIAENRLDDD